ncbi:hypothetical protein B0H14DRAFT_2544344, partial [Mycena olivaceomarginata]
MVSSFRDIHLKSLTDYKGAQNSLQKATATSNGFGHSSSNGTPALVLNHLKLPSYQLVKAATGADNDPRVTTALETANTALAAAQAAATNLLSTIYTVQVEHCRASTNVGTCADRFAAELSTYCADVVRNSGYEDVDRYETAVAMLKSAFTRELEELNIDFAAKLMKTTAAKEAKAITLANARADAEMLDVTKPVTELVGDEIKKQFALQLPGLIETLKKNVVDTTPQTAASSSNSRKASSSSSKTRRPEQPKKKQDAKPKPAQPAKASSSKAKTGGSAGNGNTANQAGTSKKEKGKGKAKA